MADFDVQTFAQQSTEDRRRLHRLFQRFARTASVILAVLFLIQLLLGLASIKLNGQASDRAKDAKSLAQDIQDSRRFFIRQACEEQNRRNAQALRFLSALPTASQRSMSPEKRAKLLHGFTDAIVGPVRDCDAVVRQVSR